MAITTYQELKDAIARWLYRDDLTAVIPDFIALAESRLNRDLRLRQMETSATGTLSSQTLSPPADLGEIMRLSITVNGMSYDLTYISPGEMERHSYGTGQPRHYTIQAGTIYVVPSPDASYPYTLFYIKDWTALSVSSSTNWFLTANPDAYLYASLLEAAPYLGDDTKIAVWQAAYGRAIETIQRQDDNARYALSMPLTIRSDSQ